MANELTKGSSKKEPVGKGKKVKCVEEACQEAAMVAHVETSVIRVD